MQEVLTEQYNDQLRELREAGLSESSPEVRNAVRQLRDEERAPLDSVQVQLLPSFQAPGPPFPFTISSFAGDCGRGVRRFQTALDLTIFGKELKSWEPSE